MIFPSWYNFCAEAIVALELKPSLELASCCKVDVVNGAAGFLVPGVFEISLTTNSAGFRLFKNSLAASSVSNF